MPSPWGPLARYCLCSPLSLTPSSFLRWLKIASHILPPILFLLLNPFCKLQTSCVLLIRTWDPWSSAYVVWCLTIQVQYPLGTNQRGLSLQRSRQMYAAQVPAPPVIAPLFEICNKSLIRNSSSPVTSACVGWESRRRVGTRCLVSPARNPPWIPHDGSLLADDSRSPSLNFPIHRLATSLAQHTQLAGGIVLRHVLESARDCPFLSCCFIISERGAATRIP